jgi:putative FmdB family regulatory protein
LPTYAYQCESCGTRHEKVVAMSQHSEVSTCACGEQAQQVCNWQGDVIVKGNCRPFKLDGTCVPIGWEHGNTDVDKQQARYSKLIAEKKKLARHNDKQAIKGGIRHIASVPRELYRMRRNQYGKDYLNPAALSEKELVAQLKSDGLYLHKDG